MKKAGFIAVGLSLASLWGVQSHAQGVISLDGRATMTVAAPEVLTDVDPIITGSTSSILPNSPSLGSGSIENICDRDCQLKRREKWRGIIADE